LRIDGNFSSSSGVGADVRRLVIALALVAAACGGSAATTPDPSGDTAVAATPSSDSTSDAGGDSTSSGDSTDRVRPDGPDAPEFTLALGEGGSFTLSQEQKPVYMVFWAEW